MLELPLSICGPTRLIGVCSATITLDPPYAYVVDALAYELHKFTITGEDKFALTMY